MMHSSLARPLRFACISLIPSAVLALAGCSSMSGLDGSSEYGCKAPEGVKCDSVSGNYYNALQNNLPSQRSHRQGMPSSENKPTPQSMAPTSYTPSPLRAQARVLRMWIKPWEDLDRDFNDQAYVYVQIDSGHWLVEHAQREIRGAYAPVRPPRNPVAQASPADVKSTITRPTIANSPAETASGPIAQAINSLQERGQSAPFGEDR